MKEQIVVLSILLLATSVGLMYSLYRQWRVRKMIRKLHELLKRVGS